MQSKLMGDDLRVERKLSEEELFRIAAIVESSEDAIIGNTLNGIITNWNKGAENIYGYPAEDVVGKSISILASPDHKDEIPNILKKIKKGEKVTHFQTVQVAKDFQLIHVSLTVSPMKDKQGKIIGASMIARDISEQKQTEEAFSLKSQEIVHSNIELKQSQAHLNESHELYQKAITQAEAVLYYRDYTTEKFTFFGENIKTLTGYSNEEITPKIWKGLIQECVMRGANKGFSEEQAIRRVRSGEVKEWKADYRIRRNDGEIRWMFDSSIQLLDSQDKPIGSLGILQDITERKQAEHEVAKFKFAIENSNDVIFMTDIQENFTYTNPTFEKFYGYTQPELVGKTPRILKSGLHPKKFYEHFWDTLFTKQEYKGQIINKTMEGKIVTMEETVSPIMDISGLVLGYMAIQRDITERKLAEEKIQESEEKFRQVTENIDEVFWMTDSEKNRMIYISSRFEEIWGRTCESLYEQPNIWIDAIHPEDRPRIQSLMKKQIRGKYHEEYRIVRPDGTIRWIRDRAFPVQDKSGKIYRIAGIVQDITERKLSESNLLKSHERYQKAITQAEAVLYQKEYTTEKFVLFGENIKNLTGYSSEELTPEIWKQLVQECIMRGVNEGLSEAEAVQRIRSGQVTEWKADYRICRRDGKIRWMFDSSIQLLDTQGKPIGSLGILQDITERKLAEERIKESEEKFRQIAEKIHEVFWMTDSEKNTMIYVSPGYEEIWGRKISDLYASPNTWFEAIHPEDRDTILQLAISKQVKGEYDETYRIVRPDGSFRWIRDRAFPIQDNTGKVYRIAGVAEDVSEYKKSQEEIQHQLERIMALHDIDLAISNSMNLQIILNIVLDQTIQQLNVDACAILLLNSKTQTLKYTAGRGFHSKALLHTNLRLGEGNAGTAVLEDKLIHIPNLREKPGSFKKAPELESEKFVSYYAVPLSAKGQVKGVLEIFHRKPLNSNSEWLDFLLTLAGQAAIAIDEAEMFENLRRSNLELGLAYESTIEGWSKALDLRDKETEGHTQRVTELTIQLAKFMGIGEEELTHIRRGALLHDIGKMGIPDKILFKKGPLTKEEWDVMKMHPIYAYDLLYPITHLRPALEIPYCHHEKWDGSGYPRGLKGENIPLSARIFALADVWDAFRSDRPYRKAWDKEKVLEHIKAGSGTHFDPKVVEVFLNLEYINTVA